MSGAVQSCKEVTVTNPVWQNVDKISIACSSVDSGVYIKLDTKNFKEGDEIKVNIVDNTNKGEVVRENVAVKVRKGDNSDSVIAISDEIEIEKEWIFKELAIKVPKFIYEEDAERNIPETELSEVKGSKLSVIADYLDVKIKVLDVRSNKPVANAVVKAVKIIDESGNTELLKTEFDHKATKLGSVSQSNTRSKLSIKALKSLLNKTDKVADSYDDKWKKAYKEYWNARIPDANIEYPQQGTPKDNILDLIIRDYNDQVATDSNGILTIHIPAALLKDKSARIEIGFWNFPVVKESVVSGQGLCRDINLETGQANDTHFIVSWGNGTQSTEWGGNFNWIVSSPTQDSEEDENNRAELKVSESFTIKDSTEEIFSIKPNLRSFLYAKDGDPHFILFAMEWCQPVYDFVDDPNPEEDNTVRSNDSTFVNMKLGTRWIRGLNMHIPSIAENSGAYYGRRATTSESPKPRGSAHNGIDLYSGPDGNYPVFAVHAGKLTSKESNGGYGFAGALALQGSGHPSFYYAHLSEKVMTKEWVMAGEKIGFSGITRNVENGKVTDYFSGCPFHLHFEFFKKAPNGNGVPGISSMHPRDKIEDFVGMSRPDGAKYNILDKNDPNALMFLGMNNLPILFPCRCIMSSSGNKYDYECRVLKIPSKNDYDSKVCYAISSFPYTNNRLKTDCNIQSIDLHPDTGLIRYLCPHVYASEHTELVMQAKIKYLMVNRSRFSPAVFTYDSSEETTFNSFFKTEGLSMGIDGSTGTITREGIRCLIRAWYYCSNSNLTMAERILKENDPQINDDKITAFKNKFVSDTDISTAETYSIIRDFYDWFYGLDVFSDMCHNVVIE